jgi:hypothetical protein
VHPVDDRLQVRPGARDENGYAEITHLVAAQTRSRARPGTAYVWTTASSSSACFPFARSVPSSG